MKIEDVAKVCHGVNKAYCEACGDMSFTEWETSPEWQKESAIDGVIFHLTNPDAAPSDSHDKWLSFKTQCGWKYGKVKDSVLMTHPCMVPYDDLPVEQKAKDYIFREICHQLKNHVYCVY